MSSGFISVTGARHHNLKNIAVEIPLHQLTVVTGLSGSGKSSLAFDTLYAEGQRRYVETFSPYTRQFLERMDKPDVEKIEGIPPAIAIEQSNPVKSSRSTVGTMTEIADHLKLLFPHLARLECPKCHRPVKPWTGDDIAIEVEKDLAGREVLIVFAVQFPSRPSLRSAFAALKQQGFLRVWWKNKIQRTDETPDPRLKTEAEVVVIQDRLRIDPTNRARLREAINSALRQGRGIVRILDPDGSEAELRFASRWHCPYDNLDFAEPTPSLFSFNNPVGACPTCRGFGRTIEIDYERALPDRTKSIAGGVVKPWQSGQSAECQRDLLKHCKRRGIPVNVPFHRLKTEQQRFVIDGEVGETDSLNELWEAGGWYGVKGFFQWLETKTYKMHVRVFLSRYRSYQICPVCHGARFQPATLNFKIHGNAKSARALTLAEVNRMTLDAAHDFLQTLAIAKNDEAGFRLRDEIVTRLYYLIEVGLGYLSLDRSTRTLSGGEIERVNLTSCLGNSLVNTLFVLDEPSIGLHSRDTARLARVICRLRDRGNTVVVVEHDETLMRQADHLLELGPGRGEQGGEVVFSGAYDGLIKSKSLTGDYLAGRKVIPVPEKRRPRRQGHELIIEGAAEHNLKGIDVRIPLGLFVVVSGVSGSGKSTLVHDVLCAEWTRLQQMAPEDGGSAPALRTLKNGALVSELTRIDQSPLTKTPRSNAILYLGVYEKIRSLFASTEQSVSQGITPGDFSFNGGTGRCPRCNGSGSEKIEMQFLADLFVTCPLCEGTRFQPHILAVKYRGISIDQLLRMTVREALQFFDPSNQDAPPRDRALYPAIKRALNLLDEVGLGYLRLGQPLNQLSGGEAQRIKLLSCLQEAGLNPEAKKKTNPGTTRLFVLDEPTTGLHFEDIRLLLNLFRRIVDQGDSLIVIEHNLEVIKCADWLIDLGPEAGNRGGRIVAEGTPETVTRVKGSYTGQYLRGKLRPDGNGAAAVQKVPRIREMDIPFRAENRIQIRGARHHNLKNLSLDIALNEMTVITGLSGSGKSTLAFDLLFAEGQRRYLDSLNAYARQFIEQMEKPDVESIVGIPPAVAIEQRVTRGGRKSTVATITEIHQFVRLLFAKLGAAHDPDTGESAVRQSPAEIVARLDRTLGKNNLKVLAPLIKARKGFHTEVARWAEKKGFAAMRVDGRWVAPAKFKALDRYVEHTIDLLAGSLSARMSPAEKRKIIDTALTLGRGTLYTIDPRGREAICSTHLFCPESGRSFDELDPRLFSYHSPHGWCARCQGYGTLATVEVEGDTELEREVAAEQAREATDEPDVLCPACQGERLNPVARAVRLNVAPDQSLTIGEVGRLSIAAARNLFGKIRFTGRASVIARDILPEITQRLAFLEEVGLGYLTLDRGSPTLSGGEAQRIRLAAQLGSNLQGVLYVLDEPTIGLHPRDNERLLDSLDALKARGNTLVVVEHDEDTMKRADQIIDLGPGAGTHGGRIVARGSWRELAKRKDSVTGLLLGQPLVHPMRGQRRPINDSLPRLIIRGARAHNLKNIDVSLPLGRFIAISGVSGAGKSTLMHDIIKPAASRTKGQKKRSGPWKSIQGAEQISAVYEVDQSPIGKTSRSTPATYVGLMDDIRALMAQLPLAKQRGFDAGHFSFNSGTGRCQACLGQGAVKVEMNFLPPMFVPCETCQGRRYNAETLEITYKDKNIRDILNMTIEEAALFFDAVPRLQRPLQLLTETGLGYVTLGQRSPTLSGGEAQRIKLVAELSRSLAMNTQKRLGTRGFQSLHHVYLLEEPTIGLHLADVQRLLGVIHQLVDAGHTVVVIEHHLDVIAEADFVLEMGPESGEAGGEIVAAGTPEKVARSRRSATAPFLRRALGLPAKLTSR